MRPPAGQSLEEALAACPVAAGRWETVSATEQDTLAAWVAVGRGPRERARRVRVAVGDLNGTGSPRDEAFRWTEPTAWPAWLLLAFMLLFVGNTLRDLTRGDVMRTLVDAVVLLGWTFAWSRRRRLGRVSPRATDAAP